MGTAQPHPTVASLPIRPLRAATLAFLGALALVQVGAGAVVAQAWKLTRDHTVLPASQRDGLGGMLDRVRGLEGVIIAGATATAVLWAVVILVTATRVHHRDRYATQKALVAWLGAPVALFVFGSVDDHSGSAAVDAAMLVGRALVLLMPFAMIGKVADDLGARKLDFLRWYLAVVVAFLVHHVFTGRLDLHTAGPDANLGRTAAMYLMNALVIGLMVVVASASTRNLHEAVSERAWQMRVMRDDAQQRGVRVPLSEPGLPTPPAPVGSLVAPDGLRVATLPAPGVVPAPAVLAPPVVPVVTPAEVPVLVGALAAPAFAEAPAPAAPAAFAAPLSALAPPTVSAVAPVTTAPAPSVPSTPAALPALSALQPLMAAVAVPVVPVVPAVDPSPSPSMPTMDAAPAVASEPVAAAVPSMFGSLPPLQPRTAPASLPPLSPGA